MFAARLRALVEVRERSINDSGCCQDANANTTLLIGVAGSQNTSSGAVSVFSSFETESFSSSFHQNGYRLGDTLCGVPTESAQHVVAVKELMAVDTTMSTSKLVREGFDNHFVLRTRD